MKWTILILATLILSVAPWTSGMTGALHAQTLQNLNIFHHNLAPWTTTGSAWGLVNTPRPGLLQPGPRPESQAGGEATTGTIRSPDFVVTGDMIQFLANGWDGRPGRRGLNGYFLKQASDGKILRQAAPPQQDAFLQISWLVSNLRGQKVYFEAVDRDTGKAYAWLGFADLQVISLDVSASKSHLFAVPLPQGGDGTWKPAPSDYCQTAGVPFLLTQHVPIKPGGFCEIPLNHQIQRLYLAGFTSTWDNGEPTWGNPNDWQHILFIGDRMGTLVLDYRDGTSIRYPLIYGYSAWWYALIQMAPQPFESSLGDRRILERALALRPIPGGGAKGPYMGVITPHVGKIKDLRIEDNPDKAGVPVISGITVDAAGAVPAGWRALPHDRTTTAQTQWIASHALVPNASRSPIVQASLRRLRELLYTTPRDFPPRLPISIPPDYKGPQVQFRGTVYADILTSVFYNDVQDILNKIGPNGMYHTSTPGAPEWWYTGVGTWRNNVGAYARQSWGRDLGRSLQEITELGFLNRANRVADYCFREARLWATEASLKYKGVQLPPHWCRVINIPSPILQHGVFENDAHGLIMLFTYKLWQREPHPRAWVRSHWKDILAAGNWIGWQLDHPAISGASDGVLMTDSECAGGIGHAKYADFLCEQGLRAYATMAASIDHTATARQWRATADRLLKGIEKVYFIKDRWGPDWTLTPAGWPNLSTNMGPLITLADRRGFAPEDNIAGLHIRDLDAFRRLVSSYHPFGFYGTAMGYGQGFVTEAALLLDRMRDATTMLNWFAREIYYPRYKPYITPEGCQVQQDGKYWHRTGDLGNGVQEGETVKTLRLVIGVDDNHPDHTQLIPRLPIGWTEIRIKNFPLLTVTAGQDGQNVIRNVNYRLQCDGIKQTLQFSANKPVALLAVRMGPFADSHIQVKVDGHQVAGRITSSGDSYWVWLPEMRSVRRFDAQVMGKSPVIGNGRSATE